MLVSVLAKAAVMAVGLVKGPLVAVDVAAVQKVHAEAAVGFVDVGGVQSDVAVERKTVELVDVRSAEVEDAVGWVVAVVEHWLCVAARVVVVEEVGVAMPALVVLLLGVAQVSV